MIKLYFIPEENKDVHICISNSRWFSDLLNICQTLSLEYSPELKHYLVSPKRFMDSNIYEDFRNIDDVVFEKGSLDLIKERAISSLQTKCKRFKVDSSLIIVPPLVGKEGEYQNYQYEGLIEGLKWNRRYFAWSPGLGKSWLMLNQLNQLYGAGLVDKALIVCKAEGVVTTKKKILQFSNLFKEEDLLVVNTSKERRYFLIDDILKTKKVVLITYTTWRALVEEEAKKQKKTLSSRTKKELFDLEKLGWGTKRVIMMDESQELGNHRSKQSKAISIHKEFFDYRYCYSGSPADESPFKWFNQLKTLDEGIIDGTYDQWVKTIAKMGMYINGKFNRFIPSGVIQEKYDNFKKTILYKYVNFKSKDVLELPEKREEDIYVELTELHKDIINEIVQMTLIKIKEENGLLSSEKVRKNLMAVHSVLDNPSIYDNDIKREFYDYSPKLEKLLKKWNIVKHSKIEALDSIVDRHISNGKKVIIFSTHPKSIDELCVHYEKHKPIKIHGEMKPKKGQSKDDLKFEVATKFQEDDKVKLGIFSSLSFKTSIDLYKADVVAYFDFTGSFTDYDQSMSRVYRNGLNKSIDIYRLVIENTLNERSLKLLLNKELEKDSLFNKKTSLSKDEYISILKGEVI